MPSAPAGVALVRRTTLLSVLCLLLVAQSARSDAWDCMSFGQAALLEAHIESNPYVIDCCDNCDEVAAKYDDSRVPAYLLRVWDPSIIECGWDPERFSVQVEFETLGWGYTSPGTVEPLRHPADLPAGEGPAPVAMGDPYYSLTLNYHWTLQDSVVERLGDVIGYEDSMGYSFFERVPAPREVRDRKERKAYKRWLRKQRRGPG